MTRSFIFRTALCFALASMLLFSSGCSQTAKAESTTVFSDRMGCNLSGIQYFPDWYAKYSSKIYVFDEDTYKPSVWLDINSLFQITTNENGTPSLTLSNFIIYENKLFLFVKDMKANSAAIYRCDLDGKNISQLATVENVYSILNIAGIQNKLYFTNILDDGKNSDKSSFHYNDQNAGGSLILCLDLDGNKLSYIANKEQDYTKCAQIMAFDDKQIYYREDIGQQSSQNPFPYFAIYPGLEAWCANIDHTDLFSYQLNSGKILQMQQNMHFDCSLVSTNNNLYYIDLETFSSTINKLDLKTNEKITVFKPEKPASFTPFLFGDNVMFFTTDYQLDGNEQTYYLLNFENDTIKKLPIQDSSIEYASTYAKLQKGYIMVISYRNSHQYGYVNKADLNDFETKMVPFNFE